MSYLVAEMKKVKSSNSDSIDREIDYDLVNDEKCIYFDKIMRDIKTRKTDQKAIRKDAVLVNEWLVSSNQDFFNSLDPVEIKKFFECAVQFFENRYTKENIAYAQVDLKSNIPRMFLGVLPLRDGKLQSKNIFTRKELLAIHTELAYFLQTKEFDIQRGETNAEGEKISLEVTTLERERDRLKKEMQELEENILASKKYLECTGTK